MMISLLIYISFTQASGQGIVIDWEKIGYPIDALDVLSATEDTLLVLDADSIYSIDLNNLVLTDESEVPGTNDALLYLSSDTLIASNSAVTQRSTDRGQSWTVVYSEGGALFQSNLDGANAGTLLTRINDSTGVGYSLDRGETWNRAVGLETSSLTHRCAAFEEIMSGPHVGRLIAGCLAGMAYSDDLGINWNLSNLWIDFTYNGVSIITALNGVLYSRIEDPEEGFGLWSSSDGEAWTRVGTIPSQAHLIAVEGGPNPEGTFYAVGRRGEFHMSLNAGLTWEELPDVYAGEEVITVNTAILGSDNRIYVAVTSPGAGPKPYDGVYRTTESVIVANEPDPVPHSEHPLHIYPNPATDFITVETDAEAVEVLDVLGRVVLRAGTGGRIDISNLPVGVYLIRAGSQSKRFTVLR